MTTESLLDAYMLFVDLVYTLESCMIDPELERILGDRVMKKLRRLLPKARRRFHRRVITASPDVYEGFMLLIPAACYRETILVTADWWRRDAGKR
jgi:hypothetical protein